MSASRVTLPEVAARAGVSLGSASRALHGTGASPTMVRRVRAAAAELGYQPDATGRSLRTRRTHQIAFAVADIGNPVYVEMMTAIQRAIAGDGYRLLVAETGNTPEQTADLVRSLATGLVDGLVISPLRVSPELVMELRKSTIPVVVIGRRLVDEGLDSVSTDSAGGIGLAVDHVIGLGRRRIAFLNGPAETTPGQARLRGFETAAAAAGLDDEQATIVQADDFTVAAGHQAITGLLAGSRPDAIVAANDLLAIGAIKAAREAGLEVPADLVVTGMDDTELGRVFQPALTSVSLHSSQRGEAAARLILDRLADRQRSWRGMTVAPELVVRESSRTPEVTR